MTEDEVRDLIRSYAERAGSVRALAKEWNVSQAYLDKQIRGVQAVGELVLRKLNLIRRKVYEFFPESEALESIGRATAYRIATHDAWREEQGVTQREQGHGSPMTRDQLARLFGITPLDMARLLRASPQFPNPDTRIKGAPAWHRQTIYGWLRSQARRNGRS